MRQEKLNKIEAERKANTPVMSQKSRQIMKHRVHTPTTLYDRHNAMKEVQVKKKAAFERNYRPGKNERNEKFTIYQSS